MRRFALYTAVGALATAVHYLVLVVAVEAAGGPAYLGAGAGAIIGAQVAYFGNRRYTFAHRGPLGPSWLKFQGAAIVGAVLGMTIVAVGVRAGLHYLVAQVLATAITLLLTFAINRRWSFR